MESNKELDCLAGMIGHAAQLEGANPLANTRAWHVQGFEDARHLIRSMAGASSNLWPSTMVWWLNEFTEAGVTAAWLRHCEAEQVVRHAEVRRVARINKDDITLEYVEELESRLAFSELVQAAAEEYFPSPPVPEELPEEVDDHAHFLNFRQQQEERRETRRWWRAIVIEALTPEEAEEVLGRRAAPDFASDEEEELN